MAELLQGLLIIAIVFFLVSIVMIIAQWKIFTKAGKPGWASIIPIYNTIVFCEIAGRPWWTIFMFMIPIYGLIVAIQVVHGVSKSFGKDAGFTCGLIFLPVIFFAILGFGNATYTPPTTQTQA